MAGPLRGDHQNVEIGARFDQVEVNIEPVREHERRARIDSCKLDRFAPAFRRLVEFSRLHNGRVQIQVVRHYGGSKNTDADVKHFLVCDDVWTRDKPKRNPYNVWFGKN